MKILLTAILIAAAILFILGFAAGFFTEYNDKINAQYFDTQEEYDEWAKQHDK